MIKVGPAGSDGLGNLKGVQKAAALGLDCMEVAFTYGVRMDLKSAKVVGALAKEQGIILSVHAPYYINLASDEKEKFEKGERKHIRTTEAFFKPLARALIQRQVDITIICESPKPYEDAIMMKKLIKKLELDII